MQRTDKELVVAELTERLRVSQALIVADYRGLTNAQLEGLRTELDKHGARLSVVKNTLTRLAAEAAGADAVLALLEGPTAIAFIESDGDPVAVAKALGQTARETRVLAIRGGVLEGRSLSTEDVDSLSKLPPLDVLRGQVLGAVAAPLYAIVGLFAAPLQDLYGLIDARIAQLEEGGGASEGAADGTPAADAGDAAPADEAQPASAGADEEPAEPVTEGAEAAADPVEDSGAAAQADPAADDAAGAEVAPAAEEAPAAEAAPVEEASADAEEQEAPAADATESVESAVEAEGSSDE